MARALAARLYHEAIVLSDLVSAGVPCYATVDLAMCGEPLAHRCEITSREFQIAPAVWYHDAVVCSLRYLDGDIAIAGSWPNPLVHLGPNFRVNPDVVGAVDRSG
jgi:hypothetical protein